MWFLYLVSKAFSVSPMYVSEVLLSLQKPHCEVGEVTCGGLPHLTRKRDHIKMRDCMDRRATPPKQVTSPTWGPLPSCKQALNMGVMRVEDCVQICKKI